MHIAEREIGEVEITIEELNAVSGGSQNNSGGFWGTMRDAVMAGFEKAGGTVDHCYAGEGCYMHSNNQEVHF